MSASLKLEYEQIRQLIDQLNFDEKEKLARYLDDQTLFLKLRKFQKLKKGIPLTFEDITEEVDAVREEMYRAGRH
jgi:hypothetical protein